MEVGAIIKHDIQKAPRTGSWKYVKPKVDEEKCVGCGTCVKFCPEACIELSEDKKANIGYEWCKGCGVCAEVCFAKAISMKKN